MNTTTVLQSLATWVLWNSSGAAVLVVLILAVRLIVGRAMSPRLRSQLWLLVVVRLLIPLLPAVSLSSKLIPSASTLIPLAHQVKTVALDPVTQRPVPLPAPKPIDMGDASTPQFVVVEDGMAAIPTPVVTPLAHADSTIVVAPSIEPTPVNWRRILLAAWAAGAAMLLIRLLISTIRLSRITRQLDLITDPHILELLDSCCELFRINRIPRLLASGAGSAPALVGVVRPKILLPASLAAQLSLDEIRLIFLHELAHLRRRDVLVNYLFATLAAFHWFNPLVWIARWRMSVDRELACDEAVLQLTSRRHARMYGCTILKLVELLNLQRLPAGAVGVVQNKTLIQRRIDMIASYPSRTARSSLLVRCAAVTLSLAAAVSAIRAQEAPAAAPAAPPTPSVSPVPAASPTPSALPAPKTAAADPAAPTVPATTPPLALPSGELPVLLPPSAAGAPDAPSPGGIGALPRGPYLVDPNTPDPLQPPRRLQPGPDGQAGRFGGAAAAMMGGFGGARSDNATASVEDAAARQANAEVMKKLAAARPADFNSMNLRDALSYIADAGRLDIVIDERALSEAGVDMVQTQVSMRVQPKPIEQLLSLTLRLATPQLDYSIYNGVVFVSSRDALNRRIVTRIYDVPAKLDREGMLQMISTAVGAARCNFFEDKIVITAPEVAQRDIARLLAQLEPQAPRASDTGKSMFLYKLRNSKASEVAERFPKELGIAAADDRTNSVLVTTTQADQAKGVVEKLDAAGQSGMKEASGAQPPRSNDAAGVVRNLEEALTSLQATYGPDSPKVKILEQQLAAARIRGTAAGADAKPIPPIAKSNPLEIDQMKSAVAAASEARRHMEQEFNDLTRREASGDQPVDPNFTRLKKETSAILARARLQEAQAQAGYAAAVADAKLKQDSAPGSPANEPSPARR